MAHQEAIVDIKRRAGRIKTLMDQADPEGRWVGQALYNANAQLNRIRTELENLETTLGQYVGPDERQAVKMGPSEVKAGEQG